MLFECHITLKLRDGKSPIVKALAADKHWKTSEIARDPVLGDDTFFYLTTHANDWRPMWDKLIVMKAHLSEAGVEILREKIELIVYDTKAAK